MINPELLARKFSAFAMLENPRLARQLEANPKIKELHFWLQQKSSLPGGLPKFVSTFLAEHKDAIGTAAMIEAGAPKDGRYTVQQAAPIAGGFRNHSDNRAHNMAWKFQGYSQIDLADIEAERTPEDARLKKELAEFTPAFARNTCIEEAERSLADVLQQICEDERLSFQDERPWWCHALPELLLATMEAEKTRLPAQFAVTEVTRNVWDGLEYAVSESDCALIQGNSRFGKTEAALAWAGMNAGRARYVQAVSGATDSDFFRAIAKALGITHRFTTPIAAIRERAEYVIQTGQLFLIFDEAQFLWPMKFTKNTPPTRLNWIRTAIIDRGIPCALLATPQSNSKARAAYVKATGYVLEQFAERITGFEIADEIKPEDMIAVAAAKFPDFELPVLKYIALNAAASDGLLKTVTSVAKLARYRARKEGVAMSRSHVDAALAQVGSLGKLTLKNRSKMPQDDSGGVETRGTGEKRATYKPQTTADGFKTRVNTPKAAEPESAEVGA